MLALQMALAAGTSVGGIVAEFLLQLLHGGQRMFDGLFADHDAEAREIAADHVVEHAMAGMAFHVVEEQRGAFLAADEIGDRRRLHVGIDFGGNGLEFAERIDLLHPDIEVGMIVANAGLGVGGFGLGGLLGAGFRRDGN